MRVRSVSLGALFAVAVITGAWAGQHAQRPVVVELFTSQGCSDCPAADRLVTELAKRKDVIALSLPIPYWDMLGWKDTYATDANTQRQKSYDRAMNRSGIYTPQMIIDGRLDVVGNQRDRVLAALMSRAGEDADVPLVICTASGREEIAIPASKSKSKTLASIWVGRRSAHRPAGQAMDSPVWLPTPAQDPGPQSPPACRFGPHRMRYPYQIGTGRRDCHAPNASGIARNGAHVFHASCWSQRI